MVVGLEYVLVVMLVVAKASYLDAAKVQYLDVAKVQYLDVAYLDVAKVQYLDVAKVEVHCVLRNKSKKLIPRKTSSSQFFFLKC